MKALDLYRQLPKTNCGRCGPKACMPFALSVIKGDADLSSCPLLDPELAESLRNSVSHSDWQEELIQSLRLKVQAMDISDLSADLGGEFRNGRFSLFCLGREFEITPDGEIRSALPMTQWIKILLLHYISTHGKADLSGKWVSFGELRNGMMKASSFLREVEEPLREIFDADAGKTAAALAELGAALAPGFPTAAAWSSLLLPKIPVVILYWPGEDEFPSKAKILFDRTADRFLDVESLMFLLEGFVKDLEQVLARESAE